MTTTRTYKFESQGANVCRSSEVNLTPLTKQAGGRLTRP